MTKDKKRYIKEIIDMERVSIVWLQLDTIEIDELDYENRDINKQDFFKIKDKKNDMETMTPQIIDIIINKNILSNMIYDYLRAWNHLRQQAVIEKYNITDEVFDIIKTKFAFTKDTLSTDLVETFKEATVYDNKTIKDKVKSDIIVQKTYDNNLIKISDPFIEKYEKLHKNHFKNRIQLANELINKKWELNVDKLDELAKEYMNWKDIENENIEWWDDKNSLTAILPTLYLNHSEEDNQETIDFLRNLIQEIKTNDSKCINIVLIGDLAKALYKGWLNPKDPNTIKKDFSGADDLIIEYIEILSEMIEVLLDSWHKVKLLALASKHKKYTRVKRYTQDICRAGSLYILYTLKNRFKNRKNALVHYSLKETFTSDIQGFRYIFHYGDNRKYKEMKKQPEKTLNNYWKQNKKNIIITSEEEALHISEKKDVTIIGAPSQKFGALFIDRWEHQKPNIEVLSL